MDKRLIILAIALVLLSADAMALGLTPARTTIDFMPNSQHTVSYTVTNTDHKDMRLLIYTEGGLNDSITLHDQIVEFRKDEDSKTFKYEVKLPGRMEPGRNMGVVVVREIPSGPAGTQTRIGATVGLITQVVVNVPYPGKYLKIENFEISESQKGGTTTFAIPVSNLGTDRLFSIKGIIDILGPTNERLATVETGKITLDPQKREVLKADWVADLNSGTYHAVATVIYEGGSDKIEKSFNIGSMNVEVVRIQTKNYVLGGIAKIDITLRSEWNTLIEKLYGVLEIKDKNFDRVGEVRTASVDILPHSSQEINAYWDTAGIKEGKYYMTLKVHMAGLVIEKQLESYVGIDSLDITMISATGEAIKSNSPINKNSIISVAVIVLIIMNIFWFVYFKRRMGGKQPFRPYNGRRHNDEDMYQPRPKTMQKPAGRESEPSKSEQAPGHPSA